ncbi:uncharacterized protein B0I36DRAFT_321603 [Microdochium trichocladiopsis]|uniref:LPXTG-domain-containing protein n=1 Tax=Microdochium trichocladiopsis TaxID=1682393 RepID=A0A9P9BS10_9PEZI|nr:uncharacterized protein B0I36DRAFT_321603 [Microdochium trichocladiopsis]KAH7033506.1 hypothetical protein B0I36DRAFT_321603 [Microdochium trichocladiopsis]
MIRPWTVLALASSATAILVTTGSDCSSQCGNVLSYTPADDVACGDIAMTATSTGTVFRNCLSCQIASDYVNTGAKPVTSDLQSTIYNLRFALSHCLFDFGTNPCITSTACEPLKNALQYENLAPNVTSYGYCSTWSDLQVPKCSACLKAMDGGHYLVNYLQVLDGACDLRLQPPQTIPLDGDIFNTDKQVQVTVPSATAGPTGSYNVGPFSYGQLAGIVIGGVVVFLLLLGCGVVINGKRRRKAYLRKRGQMHKTWPGDHGGSGGGEMFETPVSQKPLRGWGDSPVSAVDTEHTFQNYTTPVSAHGGAGLDYQLQLQLQQQQQQQQGGFPRYFSPYATPVEPTKNIGWPVEQQQNIGMAVSPDTDDAVYWGGSAGDTKGKRKGSNDEYELQEGVNSGGGHQYPYVPPPPAHQAPMLSHPGYGRQGNTPPGSSGQR